MKNLKKEINTEEIENLIPHRKPFLLIDKLIEIVPMISATGVMNIKKNDFFLMDISQVNQLCQVY